MSVTFYVLFVLYYHVVFLPFICLGATKVWLNIFLKDINGARLVFCVCSWTTATVAPQQASNDCDDAWQCGGWQRALGGRSQEIMLNIVE